MPGNRGIDHSERFTYNHTRCVQKRGGHSLQLSASDQLSCGPPARACVPFSRPSQRQNTPGGPTKHLRAFSALPGRVFCGRQNMLPHSRGARGKSSIPPQFRGKLSPSPSSLMPPKSPP